MSRRLTYFGFKLNHVQKGMPLLVSFLKYRAKNDRVKEIYQESNLISSLTTSGKHKPIIDLDDPHIYKSSSTLGHGHLFLNIEIGRIRWWVLMCGLYVGKVIEPGFFWWSLRRGANFVRIGTKD